MLVREKLHVALHLILQQRDPCSREIERLENVL